MPPLTNNEKQKLYQKRQAVIRDLVRAAAAGVEDPDERRGQIVVHLNALGLPASDSAWFWNTMQRRGWRFYDIPVTNENLIITLESFHRNEFFPSQRKPNGTP